MNDKNPFCVKSSTITIKTWIANITDKTRIVVGRCFTVNAKAFASAFIGFLESKNSAGANQSIKAENKAENSIAVHPQQEIV